LAGVVTGKTRLSAGGIRACLKIPIVAAARSLRAERDATIERIGKEIREREATKPSSVKNRLRQVAIFRHALEAAFRDCIHLFVSNTFDFIAHL
jgi:hypothetical protein